MTKQARRILFKNYLRLETKQEFIHPKDINFFEEVVLDPSNEIDLSIIIEDKLLEKYKKWFPVWQLSSARDNPSKLRFLIGDEPVTGHLRDYLTDTPAAQAKRRRLSGQEFDSEECVEISMLVD